MCVASEVLVLVEEGAMSMPPTVLAGKLATEGPALLCCLKQNHPALTQTGNRYWSLKCSVRIYVHAH